MKQNKILVIGLGNTILCDDAAGIIIGKGITEKVSRDRIDFVEASYAGWRLIDILRGYKRLIIVDSIVGDKYVPGECYKVDPAQICSLHLSSTHGMGLNEAIEFAKQNGYEMPDTIALYAVGVKNPFEFGETVCGEVMDKIPGIIDQIIREENLQHKK